MLNTKNLEQKKDYIFLVFCALVFPSLIWAQVMTVKGPIHPEDMGLTLIHEHIMVDWVGADSTGYQRWDRANVVEVALPYLEAIKKQGVGTFLDCTPAYLGRDPYVLKALADSTGLHILTNTGYYGSGQNKYIPKDKQSATAKAMASDWIGEYKNGIDGSGIRPGFIKISVENEENLSDIHTNLITAAGLTHLATGLTIVSHTGGDAPAMAQIKVLKEMGVSPSAFVWTHAQGGTLKGYMQAAKEGTWISLDNINASNSNEDGSIGNIDWFVQTLTKVKEMGILDHILISHDAGWYNVGQKNGGDYRGYTDLFTELIPKLQQNGFTEKDIDILLRQNPKRAYTIQVRKE